MAKYRQAWPSNQNAENRRHFGSIAGRLNKLAEAYRKQFGANPDMPDWGATPRGGAYWSPEELVALQQRTEALLSVHGYITDAVVVELAWHHGRSCGSVLSCLKRAARTKNTWLRLHPALH